MPKQALDVKHGADSSTANNDKNKDVKPTFDSVATGLIDEALKSGGSSPDDKGEGEEDSDLTDDVKITGEDDSDKGKEQDDKEKTEEEKEDDSSGSKKEQDEEEDEEDEVEEEKDKVDDDKEDEDKEDDDEVKDEDSKTKDKKTEFAVPYTRFKEVNDKLTQLTPYAEQQQANEKFCRANNISVEQYRNGLEIMALINRDPKSALPKLQNLVDQLKVRAGDGLPGDLQAELNEAKAEVEEGTMSEKRFKALETRLKETAKLRVDNEDRQGQQMSYEQQQQVRAQQELTSSLSQWSRGKQKVDPDFKPKAKPEDADGKFEYFLAKNQQLWSERPPKSIADAIKLADETYELADKMFKRFIAKPITKKVITSTGSTSRKKADDEPPKSMDDVANRLIKKYATTA